MRQFVLAILEPLVTFLILLNTIMGFVGGGMLGGLFKMLSSPEAMFLGAPRFEFSVGWGIAFAIFYFMVSVIGAGTIYVLLEIKDLLRRQIWLLHEQSRTW